ncbi:hypothetical protein [Nesterenkonia flava]|uniref:Uncharacterized protein n=1 Tax=Nesterenkonia flava TaxID=469799 RepID=A0ABU1FSR7_9MICC|nr:hypothetical protein [Nesterenkonia flava]MDR5711710.1 hypothetical protein [Nesterenkonia flava]
MQLVKRYLYLVLFVGIAVWLLAVPSADMRGVDTFMMMVLLLAVAGAAVGEVIGQKRSAP